jgi:hypothetical protein
MLVPQWAHLYVYHTPEHAQRIDSYFNLAVYFCSTVIAELPAKSAYVHLRVVWHYWLPGVTANKRVVMCQSYRKMLGFLVHKRVPPLACLT